ncbi:hypothetical protein ACIQJT_11015 [Streptomyces sp. NPDC091972]|uniref:hypothetical protein n=1 Tax=Streptomyces sp. NPDC091972 TaxID=3366007 RepID=UPI003826C67D
MELRPRWFEALVRTALVHPSHLDEIFGALKAADIAVHHFFLEVASEVLVPRAYEEPAGQVLAHVG